MSSKTLSIGDLHGDSHWKEASPDKYDKIIFIGDYFDDFVNSHNKQLENLLDLIEFKKVHPEKVTLLLGNHDVHYYLWHTPLFKQVKASGFSSSLLWKAWHRFKEHHTLFQVAHQINNYLWTHAGLSNGSYNMYFRSICEDLEGTLADKLNLLFKQLHPSLFHIGPERGGSSDYGSIFWADQSETEADHLLNYHQIVGHTPVNTITKMAGLNESIVYIDTRFGDKEAYELEI